MKRQYKRKNYRKGYLMASRLSLLFLGLILGLFMGFYAGTLKTEAVITMKQDNPGWFKAATLGVKSTISRGVGL